MSYYIKRISVLKQVGTGFSMNGKPLSGLAKIEKTGLNQKLTISLINSSPVTDGEYHAVVCGTDKKYACFLLGQNPATSISNLPFLIDIENGFCCLIVFLHHSNALKVAFGASGLVDCNIDKMIEALLKNQSLLNQVRVEALKEETAFDDKIELQDTENEKPTLKLLKDEDYQDELVVTDNYYLNEDVDLHKLTIKDNAYEPALEKNEYANNQDETINAKASQEKPASKDESFISMFKDPTTYDFDAVSKGQYYDKVKDELNSIFKSNPKEKDLENNIPNSKWSKIFYSDEKYYAVGLILDNELPAFICYGVPGKYSKEPPQELKGYCSYLPLSLFDLNGDGYWMMYQNAETGECVHIDCI